MGKKNSLAMTPEREKWSVRLTETLLAHSGREDYGYHYEAGERNKGLCAREFHWFLSSYNAPNGDCVNINIFGTSGMEAVENRSADADLR